MIESLLIITNDEAGEPTIEAMPMCVTVPGMFFKYNVFMFDRKDERAQTYITPDRSYVVSVV